MNDQPFGSNGSNGSGGMNSTGFNQGGPAAGITPGPTTSTPPPPPVFPPAYPPPGYGGGRRGGLWARVATGLIGSVLMLSLAMNFYFGAVLASAISGPTESTIQEGDADNRIVILPINGMINDDTASFVRSAIGALSDNPPKALVLRISSSGGGVGASDRIWHLLNKFQEETKVPIVASFGSVAASGGYYIAAACDHIIAEPTSLTGSIGVISQGFTVQDLLDKIGITPETISATQATKKDMLNPMRAWTDADRDALKAILDNAYEMFVQVVKDGRPDLSIEQVKSLATGEIFTSQQAQANGLVDQEGYLDSAIDKAAELAKLGADIEPQVNVMAPARGLGFLGPLGQSPDASQITAQQIRNWVLEATSPRLEYRELRVGP